MTSCHRLDAEPAILGSMHPYRPLHVAPAADTQPAISPLRGLAMVLMVLGMLRLLPALVTREGIGTEAAIATLMVVLGGLELFGIGRYVRRWRRKRRLA